MIVLHYTGMPDVEGAIAQLCTPAPTYRRITSCWKTAASCNACRKPSALARRGIFWACEEDINSCSIGIEIINRGHDWAIRISAAPDRRRDCAMPGIMLRRKIQSHRVLAHSDVAPARKGSR